MTRIKICGLTRPCDVDYVNRYVPDYCGFVINVPRSRRNVTPQRARELAARLNPGIVPVGVFVDESQSAVARLLNEGVIAAAQLHGAEDASYIKELRRLTAGTLIQAFRVASPADAERAAESLADYVLLDSGGGTGERFGKEGGKQLVEIAKAVLEDAKVLIMDEPTRGIDVGAKSEFYKMICEYARMGKGVILISSELPEIIGLSDRIIVMREGRVTGEVSRKDATEELILQYAMLGGD